MERAFCRDYNLRMAPIRQMSCLGLLSVWIGFMAWDCVRATQNAAYDAVLPQILALRTAVLIVAILTYALFFSSEWARSKPGVAQTWITAMACVVGLSLLGWVIVAPYPYNMLQGFHAQTVVVLSSYGLFGLLTRGALFLAGWHLTLALGMVKWCESVHNGSGLHDMLTAVPYHPGIFLFCSIVLGCPVCWLIERIARQDFVARTALSEQSALAQRNNLDLQCLNEALIHANQVAQDRMESVVALTEQLRVEALARDRERAQFLASAVHDLRQPVQALSTLLVPVTRAVERGDQASAMEMLHLSHRATHYLQEQLSAILEVSRLESGKVSARAGAVNLSALLHDLLVAWAPQAHSSGVTLGLEASAPDVTVHSDPDFLRRILGNLVSNSLKYRTTTTGVQPFVKVQLAVEGDRPIVSIIDNGIGMLQTLIDSGTVFQPFVQINSLHPQVDKGVGLGLAIVRKLVTLLPGHELTLRSEVDVGTTARLSCPGRLAVAASPRATRLSAAPSPQLRGAYVLVVEDDDVGREAMLHLLQASGAICEGFADHASFARALGALERCPDAVISDYRLPDGLTAADVAITVRAFWDDVPMLVLSGESRDLAERPTLAGQRCVHKPVDAHTLVTLLGQLVHRVAHDGDHASSQVPPNRLSP